MNADKPGFFAYILRCVDGSYYVGATSDLATRIQLHQSGNGPRYTAIRVPVTLVYRERFATFAEARTREAQWKRWSRAKKEALIVGDRGELHRLSRRRNR